MTGRHALDQPGLRRLWEQVHARLSSGTPVARVTVTGLNANEQEALADLLGLDRLPGQRTTVALARLDELLHNGFNTTSRELVTQVIGPIGDAAADRRRDTDDRTALWQWLADHPVVTARPPLKRWAEQQRATGIINGSTDDTRRFLTQALAVLAELPAVGEPLSVLAARTLEDAHALDDGTRLSTTILRALALLHDTEPPATAGERRTLWGLAGVSDDALSATVLTAGLRPAGDGPVATSLRAFTGAGHASHLTLAHLRSPGSLHWPRTPVHVFENPSVIALAIAEYGPACPPLVCTAGWPNTAVLFLMQQCAAAGAPLHYHGDFDGDGLRIAAHVIKTTGATPWHMNAADYLAAPSATGARPAVGRVTDAPWDPDLAPALRARGTALLEEHTAPGFLPELASIPITPPRPPRRPLAVPGGAATVESIT